MGSLSSKESNILEISYPNRCIFYKTDKQSANGNIYLFFKPIQSIIIDDNTSYLIMNYKQKKDVYKFILHLNDISRIVTKNGPSLEITAYNDNNMHVTIRVNNKYKILEAVCEIPGILYAQ